MAFQSLFRTTLAERLEADATSIVVATAPSVTSGRMRIIRGNSTEFISYTWVTQNANNATLTGVTRGLSTTADPITWGTGQTFAAGSQIILVAMHDQLPDRTSSDNSFTWDIVLWDWQELSFWTNFYVRRTWDDLELRDNNNANRTLSELSASWANDQVRVTNNDTSTGNLDTKLTVWNGISKAVQNPWASENLQLSTRLSTTNGLRFQSWEIDINPASNSQVGSMRFATDSEASAWTLETAAINPKQANDLYWNSWCVAWWSVAFTDNLPHTWTLTIDLWTNNVRTINLSWYLYIGELNSPTWNSRLKYISWYVHLTDTFSINMNDFIDYEDSITWNDAPNTLSLNSSAVFKNLPTLLSSTISTPDLSWDVASITWFRINWNNLEISYSIDGINWPDAQQSWIIIWPITIIN